MPPASFDVYASSYDDQFTTSEIGKLQREQVHRVIVPCLKPKDDLLEINCGTGFDAFVLASRVRSYLATDASAEMIRLCAEKQKTSTCSNLTFQNLNIQSLGGELELKNFIFSDFGGLNCLSPEELNAFASKCQKLLSPGAELFFVIMGRFCFWESLYFCLRLNFRKAFRRLNRRGVEADIVGGKVHTWYYSPRHIRKAFGNPFVQVSKGGIGVFVPPSYLDPFFHNKKRALGILKALDKIFTKFKWTAHVADHYFIHLKKTA